jgi:hydrogenase 3 maturation protease
MTGRLVFTVGNDMMGDDAAGPTLARLLEHSPAEGWAVLDGGSAPENYIFKIRDLAPQEVLIVDTADMQLAPGEVRIIDKERISSLFLVTTHSLPLSYIMDAIREFVPQVDLLGIQPETVAFGCPVSPEVQAGVERLYRWLKEHHEVRGAIERVRTIGAESG